MSTGVKTVGELRAALAPFRDDQELLVELAWDSSKGDFTNVHAVRQTDSGAPKEAVVLTVDL